MSRVSHVLSNWLGITVYVQRTKSVEIHPKSFLTTSSNICLRVKMADKYFPHRGDVIGGARELLKTILDGKLTKYPEITLKIAGIEANASKEGYPQVKAVLHKVTEAIRTAVEQAGLKKRGMGFEDVEIPPEVQQQYMPVVQEAYNLLSGMRAEQMAY